MMHFLFKHIQLKLSIIAIENILTDTGLKNGDYYFIYLIDIYYILAVIVVLKHMKMNHDIKKNPTYWCLYF